MDGAFRKIDIDQFEDDQIKPEDLYDPYSLDPQAAEQYARDLDRQVRSVVAKGDFKSGLSQLLQSPPYGDDSYTAAKQTTLNTVLFILLQVQQSEVPNLVKSLSAEEQDALMKFIYKGMQDPAEGPSGNSQCAALLNWHMRLVEVSGTGSITRTMTDFRRV